MSDLDKMYQAPANPGVPQTSPDINSGVTAATRDLIAKAAPWLKFLGVMGFIGCGLMALIALIMMFAAGLMGAAMSSAAGFGGMGAAIGPLFGIVYLALAVLCFFPARFTFKMGAASAAYNLLGQANDLEALMLNLKKIAKFFGIYIIVLLGLVVLGIIISFIAMIAAAASLH